MLASVLCVVAPNIAALGVLRVVQGVGAAAAAVVAMAVVRDLFSGDTLAQLFSRLMLVMGAAPVLAPTLGGELLRWTSWRGVFVTLAVIGPRADGARRRRPARRRCRRSGAAAAEWPARSATYGSLFRDRTYVGLVLVAGFAMAALFAYVSGSSFVLQGQFGLDEQQFGLAFGAGAVGADRRDPAKRPAAAPLDLRSRSWSARCSAASSPGWCCSRSPSRASAASPACWCRSGRCWPRPG